MSSRFKRIDLVCKKNSSLGRLTHRSNTLSNLNSVLQQALPVQFKHQCHIVNISGHKLIIGVENANIASLLRFQGNVICKKMSAQLNQDITQMHTIVRKESTPAISNTGSLKKPIALSNTTQLLLKNTADNLNNEQLKTSLYKLLKHQAKV